jgi:hypothetical protein
VSHPSRLFCQWFVHSPHERKIHHDLHRRASESGSFLHGDQVKPVRWSHGCRDHTRLQRKWPKVLQAFKASGSTFGHQGTGGPRDPGHFRAALPQAPGRVEGAGYECVPLWQGEACCAR